MNPHKRRRTEGYEGSDPDCGYQSASPSERGEPVSLDAPISPPKREETAQASSSRDASNVHSRHVPAADGAEDTAPESLKIGANAIDSPVQLIRVSGLTVAENVDTIGIRDLVGDPLIKECWAFNYLFDVEWLLNKFDEDIRQQVQVIIVHGSWKRENRNRIEIDQAIKRHANVRAITAYIPDPFGTHHTKMFVLIRHDDTAQVVIFTANLIAQDWRMCQAVWRSPMLPMLHHSASEMVFTTPPPFGTGERFKYDLWSYLDAYSGKLKQLQNSLKLYDFSSIKACFIASVPCHQNLRSLDITKKTLWGWPALQESVKRIPRAGDNGGHAVVQVSSIATLGVSPSWLHGTLYEAMRGSPVNAGQQDSASDLDPRLSIVFPTAEEIRRTIDGYACGASIHLKLNTAAHEKQLKYLLPHLCHWGGSPRQDKKAKSDSGGEAGRKRTGPHIKTYLRFADAEMKQLTWGMINSANLSKQAWGTERTNPGDVKISSFEVGVLFWPDLWRQDGMDTRMVPVFKKDKPEVTDDNTDGISTTTIGWRMPYDLPLSNYAENERPWSATERHPERDSRGRTWYR